MGRLDAALAWRPADNPLCPACHQRKPASEFLPSLTRCRACNRQMAARMRERNPDKVQAIRKRWNERNPDKVAAQRQRRIDLEMEAGPILTPQQWNYLRWLADYRCLCCGAAGRLCADHVVPLSRGGLNHISNRQPLCRACNSRKGTQIIDYRDQRFAALVAQNKQRKAA
jgi:5-methylcytosine-specific restriction endonuclease McrA